jgi:hypothetical protein
MPKFLIAKNVKFSWFVRKVANNPLYLAFFFMPIPILGLLFEYYFDLAFARSGALLVCVAIFCVYINHFLSIEANSVKDQMHATHKVGSSYEEILQNLNPVIQGEAREKAATNLYMVQ